ncbi:MAG: hypothetical protein K0S41_2078 [Anaerocolumna sp.]|nr:hypothetical protein [Anaerocolumna sp.]
MRIKRKKMIIACISTVIIVSMIVLFSGLYKNWVGAQGAENEYLKFYNFNPNAETGTEENPFIILEIVPYRGMGQIGYIVKGQEPVDISLSTYEKPFWGEVNAFAQGSFDIVKKDVLSATDLAYSNWSNRWSWNYATQSGQTGYFQKLDTPTGLYDLVQASKTFTKNKTGTGYYNWVSASNTQGKITDYTAKQVWFTNYTLEISYWKPSNNWAFLNLDSFKRKVLEIPDNQVDDFHVRVVTITPEELNNNVDKFSKFYDLSDNGKNNKVLSGPNNQGEIDLIGNADLISISPKAQAGDAVVTLWELYSRDKSGVSTDPNRKQWNFGDHDLTWQTTMELFMKVGVVDDSAAFIYDITLLQGASGDKKNVTTLLASSSTSYLNNVYKLCLLLRQRNPVELYNLYMNTNGGTATARIQTKTIGSKTTGYFNFDKFNEDARLYWSEYTFVPAFPDGTFPTWFTDEYKAYLSKVGYDVSWISGMDNTTVKRNTYSYNGDSSIVQVFFSTKVYKNRATNYDNMNDFFSYLNGKNTTGVTKTTATPCEAVDYILHQKPNGNITKSIRILNIEPCNDFTLTVDDIRKMVPSFAGLITIDQQITTEFIGKIDDLNDTYDLIYIGANIGKFNTVSGKTVYNDPKLDGLVYLHVGDRVVAFDTFKGILKNDTGSIVKAYQFIKNFSSNTTAYNQANIFKGYNYISSITGTTDFYRYPGNDITNKKKEELKEYIDAGYPVLLQSDLYNRNTNIIDDSSYLYQFLSGNSGKSELININDLTVMSGGKIPTNYYSSVTKLSESFSKNKLSASIVTAPIEYDVNNPDTLIEDRTLHYEFSINPPSGAATSDTYSWKIYVDVNADGRFVDKEMIANDVARANETIRLTKTLSKKYAGVIPWKLEIKSTTKNSIRTSKIGYTAFKILESQKTTIHILQVTSDSSTLNLQSLMNPPTGKTSLFYKYTKDLDDFDVDIKTINVTAFLNLYKGSGNAYDITKPEATDKFFYMDGTEKKSYDMLIFGFGDCYTNINNDYGALNNIQAFIDSGRSVLFTHDTTSFVNLDTTEFNNLQTGLTNWGYGFNQYLRSKVGMDRFGAVAKAGDTTVYDVASMPSKVKSSNLYANGKLTNNGTTYPEIQGLSYGVLVAFGNSKGIDGIYNANKTYPPFNTGNTITDGNSINNYHTSYVSKVNKGQITTYPYDIPDDFNISNTHVQYYQLNMEDPEIVVWYCLDNNNTTGPYAASPNDVRNNYYIYSKGNVMYTGVGHSAIDGLIDKSATSPYKENEVKLFINTMIASYSSGVTAPTVEVLNEEAVKKSATEYYIYQDSDLPVVSTEKKRITFIAEDSNLPPSTLKATVYYYDSVGNLVLANLDIKAVNGSNVIPVAGETKTFYLTPGKEYYFDLPLDNFAVSGTEKVFISVRNDDNLRGGAKVELVGLSLFDLD